MASPKWSFLVIDPVWAFGQDVGIGGDAGGVFPVFRTEDTMSRLLLGAQPRPSRTIRWALVRVGALAFVLVALGFLAASAAEAATSQCVAAGGQTRHQSGTATCTADGTGSVALALGDGSYANATGGTKNRARVRGTDSTAIAANGDNNTATVTGDNSTAATSGGDNNTATVTGDNST